MTDLKSARIADIGKILSMADMLVGGKYDESHAGLASFHEQWQNEGLNIESLRSYMRVLTDKLIVSADTFQDFSDLIDQMLATDYGEVIDSEAFEKVSG